MSTTAAQLRRLDKVAARLRPAPTSFRELLEKARKAGGEWEPYGEAELRAMEATAATATGYPSRGGPQEYAKNVHNVHTFTPTPRNPATAQGSAMASP